MGGAVLAWRAVGGCLLLASVWVCVGEKWPQGPALIATLSPPAPLLTLQVGGRV